MSVELVLQEYLRYFVDYFQILIEIVQSLNLVTIK